MKVFVEFVGSVFFVDFGLAQNPYMPTTTSLLAKSQPELVRLFVYQLTVSFLLEWSTQK